MKYIVSTLLLLITASLFGQELQMSFGKNADFQPITNGEICSLGNFANNTSTSFSVLFIQNSDPNKALEISDVAITKTDSRISLINTPPTISVNKDGGYSILITYGVSNNLEKGTETLSFKTNDPTQPEISLQVVANPDLNKLIFTPRDHTIANNKIAFGNVPINTTIFTVIELSCKGKGYMRVGKTSNVITNNQFSSSFKTPALFWKGYRFNNLITFKALKKGTINTSFSHAIEHGEQTEETITITGKVVAPVATWKYAGKKITEGQELYLPDNYFVDTEFPVTIENTGDYQLDFSHITLQNDTHSEFNIVHSSLPNIIPAGESRDIRIKFTPNKHGKKRIKVNCYSDGYESKTLEFFINIETATPMLSLSETDGTPIGVSEIVSLGTSTDGAVLQKTIVAKNTGNRNLVFTKIAEYANYPFLEIINTPKMTLAPNETTQINLKYTPPQTTNSTRSAEENALLRIESNTLSYKRFNLSLRAINKYARFDCRKDGRYMSNGWKESFGAVSVNSPKVVEYVINNTGTQQLNLSDLKIIDDTNRYYTILNTPKSQLAVGETTTLKLQYAPKKTDALYTAKLQIKTDDYLHPIFEVNLEGWGVAPILDFSMMESSFSIANNSKVEFGRLEYSRSYSHKFKFLNRGNDKLIISDFKIENTEGTTTEVEKSIAAELLLNEFFEFEIKFRCFTPGQKSIKISFTTNIKEKENFSFTINYLALAPILEVYADSKLENNAALNFGNHQKKTITLKNTGNEAFHIKSVATEGDDTEAFLVQVDEPYVRGQEEFSFDVHFSTENEGIKTTTLVIETDDVNNPVFKIKLSAENEKITTAINTISNSSIKIYPNPFTDRVCIEKISSEPILVRIYNLDGKVIYQNTFRSSKNYISTKFDAGTYIIETVLGTERKRVKMLKGNL